MTDAISAPASRFHLSVVALLFFASGLAGLVYQELWLRLLGLVFGVTVYAASTVLAGFMAGLALGSTWGGRIADRTGRPLRVYGAAEVLVGLSALATPFALDGVERLYVSLHPLLPQVPGLLTAVRFVLSIAVLLVPTLLMGATFPLVVRATLRGARPLGQDASVLYAANTAGGIAGTLLAGFYLIGGVGMAASFRLAAALNVMVGLAAIALSQGREQGPRVPAPASAEQAQSPGDTVLRRRLLLVFAISGCAALALEVVWFRVLVMFLQVTTYAFTVMLAAFLTGIAAGSACVARLFRRRREWLSWLVAVEALLAVAVALSLTALDRSYVVLSWIEPWLDRPAEKRAVLMLLASFLTLFPATFLMGLAFPIGLRLFAGEGEHTGARVGRFYAWNVCGSILGALGGGFVLLPWLGSRRSVLALAALSLVSAAWLAAIVPGGRRRRGFTWVAAATLAFAGAAIVAPEPFLIALARRHLGERLLWQQEGPQASVSVAQLGRARVLYLDGKHQADDTEPVVHVHREIGALALAVHPQPRKILVIGLGGGVTAGAAARDPNARVDVVELSRSVIEGSEWFRHVNGDLLRRPNVRLHVDDGRNVLLLTPDRFDVITADIIQPHHAGAGSLYSVEYFRLARAALADGGIMVQWISLHSDQHYKLILRTFLSVFPEASLWGDGSLVVGGAGPLRLTPEGFAKRLLEPGVREALAPLGVDSFQSLEALRRADGDALRAFVGDGPLLTDDRPLVEYFLSLPRGRDRPVALESLPEASPTER